VYRGFFSSLFQIADKEGLGRLVGREAAEFLKRSGLPKEALKVIWIISAQTDNQFLERDEFYIALRLVALAQNNMEYSEEAIIKNNPIPPLPKFDLKNSATGNVSTNISTNINKSLDQVITPHTSNLSPNQANNIFVISESDPFYMTEVDVQKYTNLFNKNKDMENKMSINKSYHMWTSGGVSTEILKRIFSIVPLADKTCLNFNEFKVVFHLIYKSLQFDIPPTLPNCLKRVLYSETDNAKNITINPNEINFGDKLGLDLNLARQKERRENLIEAPLTTISQQVNNNHNLHVNVNKSVDMEALLMNEFNLRNNATGNNINNNIPNMPQNNALDISSEKPISPNIHNIQTINNLSNHITEKLNLLYNEKLAENKFLEQTLEEETKLLKSLREEFEKIYLNISHVEQRNSQIKSMIVDVRKQISLEKENLSKGIYQLNQVTNEMLRTQNVLNDDIKERIEIAKKAVIPNQPPIFKTSNDVERSPSANSPNISNNQVNNYANLDHSNYNQLNKIKSDLSVDFRNYSPNQPNFYNQNYTNLSKLTEEKLNEEVNHNTGRLNLNVTNNFQNAQASQANKPIEFPSQVSVKDIPPIESRNYLEDNVALNKSGGFVMYPKIEGTPHTYNFDNELDIPAKNTTTLGDPITNHVNQDKIDTLNINNNYDTAGFDFNEFGDFKDSFKEFADKKGDDFFKKQSNFQANWDDF